MNKEIEATDDDALSAVMQACSARERIFIETLFDHPERGGRIIAAKAAGYGGENPKRTTLSRMATKVLRRPHVLAAMQELTQQYIRALGPLAITVVREVMADKAHKDRLKAARTVFERVDPAQFNMNVDVTHRGTTAAEREETTLQMLQWMRSMEVPRSKLIEYFGYSGLSVYEAKLEIRDRRARGEIIPPEKEDEEIAQRATAALDKLNGANRAITIDAEFVEVSATKNY